MLQFIRICTFSLWALGSILMNSCTENTSNKQALGFDQNAVAQEVEETLIAYYTSISKKGLVSEFDFLDSSDSFTWIPPGYRTPLSYDSVKTLIQENAAFAATVSNTWDTLIVHALSSTSATYTGRFKSTIIDTTGFELNLTFTETGILVKKPTGWKLLQGQTALVRGE